MSEGLNPLADFETKLKGLEPLPAGLSRDRLLFEAGRRSARPARFWPASSALLAMACLALSARLLTLPAAPDSVVASTPSRPRSEPGRGLDEAMAEAVRRSPQAGSDERQHRLSIGWMHDALLKFGVDAAAQFLDEGPIGGAALAAPAPAPSILNLEAEALPFIPSPSASIWPGWLPFGGVR